MIPANPFPVITAPVNSGGRGPAEAKTCPYIIPLTVPKHKSSTKQPQKQVFPDVFIAKNGIAMRRAPPIINPI